MRKVISEPIKDHEEYHIMVSTHIADGSADKDVGQHLCDSCLLDNSPREHFLRFSSFSVLDLVGVSLTSWNLRDTQRIPLVNLVKPPLGPFTQLLTVHLH